MPELILVRCMHDHGAKKLKAKISAAVASLLVLSAVSQGSAARQDITAIAVFMNEGRTNIQVDVVSEDKNRAYRSKRRSTIDALCPPKPNEFETAMRASASRASFGM